VITPFYTSDPSTSNQSHTHKVTFNTNLRIDMISRLENTPRDRKGKLKTMKLPATPNRSGQQAKLESNGIIYVMTKCDEFPDVSSKHHGTSINKTGDKKKTSNGKKKLSSDGKKNLLVLSCYGKRRWL